MNRSALSCVLLAMPLAFGLACGETIDTDQDQPDGATSDGGSSSGNVGRTPKKHRAAAVACDATRPTTPSNAPDGGGGPPVECHSHADCTEGSNGRCLGNGHDGWHCTYDACTTDAECGASAVCECEGGFRSDNNACLPSGCVVDADCGATGFCSPSLGSCGSYSKIVTYACHQAADECVDDEDCAVLSSGSCRFEPTVGHWKCSDSECAG